MRKMIAKKSLLVLILSTLYSVNSIAQTSKNNVSQDPKFALLLNEKRKINPSIAINEGYKIQIYNGDSESAKRELARIKSEFNYLDATIIFNTPYYKVWVGNFKTKIDAQRHLIEIQKKNPNSIIIKPSK